MQLSESVEWMVPFIFARLDALQSEELAAGHYSPRSQIAAEFDLTKVESEIVFARWVKTRRREKGIDVE